MTLIPICLSHKFNYYVTLFTAPKTEWGPDIQDDFINVFPKPPLKGHNVRMECFAYGS